MSLALRWALATGVAGALVGLAEGGPLRVAASLTLPGLLTGLAQLLVARRTVPGIWPLMSALAWVTGGLLDAWAGASATLPGVAIWLLPTAVMAAWQVPLLGPLRRTWTWLPVSLVGALVLQLASAGTCALACDAVLARWGAAAATGLSYGAGWAAFGAITGVLLATWRRRPVS